MPEYAHDPELPFVLVYSTGDKPLARFRMEGDANAFASHFMSESLVIDTTPKPLIPEDAMFIYWRDSDDQPYFARRTGDTYWETDEGVTLTTLALKKWVADQGAQPRILDVREWTP